MHLLYIATNQDCESPKLPCNIAVVASPPPRLQLAHFLVAVELLMDWFGGRFNWASQLLAAVSKTMLYCEFADPWRDISSNGSCYEDLQMNFDNTLTFKAKLYSIFMPPS